VTAVAAVLVAGTPTLVGDVVLSDGEGKRIGHAGKLYVLPPNVAIGWSGKLTLATTAITRLRHELRHRVATVEDLEEALSNLEDLRERPNEKLEITGWIVTPIGPKVIRWASHYRPVTVCDAENDIGSGGRDLRRMLVEPPIGEGNSQGHDQAPMKLISGFMEARFEEMLLRDTWPQTWGAAYDAIVYQEGAFRWLPKLTYVGWDVRLDGDDRITEIKQAPVVFTQEHAHPCTLMLAKVVGAADHEVKVSYPIDHEPDPDLYLGWRYSVVSPYYANYLRVFCPNNFLMKMCLAAENATAAGVMYHAGSDDADPRFRVNRSVLEPMIRKMLEKARVSHA
jgi:hypothetical protein